MGKEFVNRSKFRSMASWIDYGNSHGIDMKKFHSDKLEDNQRLRESGLPAWDEIEVAYRDFNEDNPKLEEFLSKYNQFLIRAIPKTPGLNKFSDVGLDFQECLNLLRQGIKPKDANHYSIILTQWEPTEYGGIIISKPEGVVIEVAKQLDELEHCQVIPAAGYSNGLGMKYTTEDIELRQLMWNSLRHVKGLEGYFEFVITKRDRIIKFIDYKISRGYLT
jgi:hypothetical protein